MGLESAHVRELRERVAGGDASADAFWGRVEARGAPLIEPIVGDPDHSLVTFLWRADAGVAGVSLLGGPEGRDLHAHRLERIGGTDVFQRSFRVRNDMRTSYFLVVDPPLDPDCASDADIDRQTWERLTKFFRAGGVSRSDPFNKLRERYRAGEGEWEWGPGVLEMPDAPVQPYTAERSGVRRGSIERQVFRSQVLGDERPVWTYAPPGCDVGGDECHLLIVFDGASYVTRVPTHRILDNLQHEGAIAPTAALLVGSPDQPSRDRELLLSEHFAACLTDELLPWAWERMGVTRDPERVTVAGSSLGGLAASFVAMRRPDLFGNVISQSGSYHRGPAQVTRRPGQAYSNAEWLTDEYASRPALPIRFFIEVGTLEDEGAPNDLLGANRRFRDVLMGKGYDVRYREFAGGHDYECWRGGLADGLIALA